MHSTTGDLAILLQTFLNGGVYGGRRVLSANTVKQMTSNQNPPALTPWGLGWKLNDQQSESWFGDLASRETFGHTGASGTVAWADPTQELICVILTSRARKTDDGFLLRRVSNVVQSAVEG
jgi:CubicO group peptidase (beta-lactamase class C family)